MANAGRTTESGGSPPPDDEDGSQGEDGDVDPENSKWYAGGDSGRPAMLEQVL